MTYCPAATWSNATKLSLSNFSGFDAGISPLLCFPILLTVPNTDKSANQTVEQSYNRIPNESFSALLSPVTYAGDQAGSRESRSSRAAESEQITQKSKRRKKK